MLLKKGWRRQKNIVMEVSPGSLLQTRVQGSAGPLASSSNSEAGRPPLIEKSIICGARSD